MGAPLDCSGTSRGEARAPGALRDAGLVRRTGARDAGDVGTTVDNPDRDARTGVIGFEQICRPRPWSEECEWQDLDKDGKLKSPA